MRRSPSSSYRFFFAPTVKSGESSNVLRSSSTCLLYTSLSQQLDSILVQLADSDELIISDDGSTDSTLRIIREYQKKYKQIVLIDGPQKGYVFNFENAIKNCKNELIFLSDQDDIWCFDKISIVKQLFNKNEKQLLLMHCLLYTSRCV